MNKLIPKNKILFQTKTKIWNNSKLLNLKKKKWKFFIKSINNSFNDAAIYQKPKNLKKLYKRRLIAKQKFKFFYGCLNEFQIKNLFKKFENKSKKMELYFSSFEKRLDVILFRLNIVSSIFEAKQLINHKYIYVNNKIVKSSNYYLKVGDLIYINKKNCKFNLSKHFEIMNVPSYLEYNKFLNIIILINEPKLQNIQNYFDNELNLVFDSISK